MSLNQLPVGSLGFDCNDRVTAHQAHLMRQAGFKFVVRYIPRVNWRATDITRDEMAQLIGGNLGVMLVQHFPGENWHPSETIGTAWGGAAALYADKINYPKGAVIWCDLEGVEPSVSYSAIIKYANNWYDAVRQRGHEPGLYLGYGNGLTAELAYWKLKFRRYWAAYNLNVDQYPAVRSIQMKQRPYPQQHERVVGIPWQYDVNEIRVDKMGSSPIMFLPDTDK